MEVNSTGVQPNENILEKFTKRKSGSHTLNSTTPDKIAPDNRMSKTHITPRRYLYCYPYFKNHIYNQMVINCFASLVVSLISVTAETTAETTAAGLQTTEYFQNYNYSDKNQETPPRQQLPQFHRLDSNDSQLFLQSQSTQQPQHNPTTINLTLKHLKSHHNHHFYLPVGVIVVIVLAGLCAIMGLIYAYVYFTRVNRNGLNTHGKALVSVVKAPKHGSELLRVPHVYDDDRARDGSPANVPPSTHVFLFKWKR